jgi:hypothetical protein
MNLCVLLPESQLISNMDLMEICCEDRTGSGSFVVVGFCIGGDESLCSATRESVNW